MLIIMINCPSCNKKIEETVKVCPHCGMDDPTGRKARLMRIGFLFFVGLVLIILVYASYYFSTH